MWCDNFDLDLYKVIPEARDIIKPVKDVMLQTHCTPGRWPGLNHPTCWNTGWGFTAFFGFDEPGNPEGYVTQAPVIETSFEDVMRDCWPHSYCIVVKVDDKFFKVWNMGTNEMHASFYAIMYHTRGISIPTRIDDHKGIVLASLRTAVQRFIVLATIARKIPLNATDGQFTMREDGKWHGRCAMTVDDERLR